MKIKQIKVEKTEIHLEEQRKQNTGQSRSAIIYLKCGFFEKCEYDLNKTSNYCFEDWEFLNKVSGEIIRIQKGLIKKGE